MWLFDLADLPEEFHDPFIKSSPRIDTRKARVCFADGRVTHYDDQQLAYAVWLGLPKGMRAAFRGANDPRPVYPWSYVDR